MSDNRREFFRVYFDHFINGEIIVDEQSIPIKIDNMSAGGMGFFTSAPIPVDVKLSCSFTILDKSFLIDGYINRKSMTRSLIEYGIEFETNLETSSALFKQLNYYEIRKRKEV